MKVIDGAGMTEAEANAAREHMRRLRDDAKAARNAEWDQMHGKALWNVVLPVVSISVLFFCLITKDPPTMTGTYLGFLLLVGSITFALGCLLGLLMTALLLAWELGRDSWRRRQTDRILDLYEDDRDTALVEIAYGGDKFLHPRVILLKSEVSTWAKDVGIKYRVLRTHKKVAMYDRPFVWFKRPEHAVAFKMRWY